MRLLSILAIFAVSLVSALASDRPNILWIYIEDQHPWFGASREGDQLVDTPNFDALAKQGVYFERTYVPVPVCSACRSSIITGQYAIRNGTHNHRSSRTPAARISLDHPTLPELFRQAGYHTFNNGKDDYNFTRDRKLLYSDGNPKTEGSFYGSKGKGDWKKRPKNTPFFGQIQTDGGKLSFRKKNLHKLIGGAENATDPAKVTVPPQYPDIPEIREAIAAHYDTVKASDTQIGQIVKRLKDEGEWDNTILFVFTDHGGNFPRAKQFCYEEGLHVPLLIVAPALQDKIKPGTRRSDLVNLLDVSATSLALAGIDIPERYDSRDLFAADYKRDHVFSSRDRCDFTIDRTRSVMGTRYHYLRNFKLDRPLYQLNYRSHTPVFKKLQALYDEGKLTPAQAAGFAKRPAEELYDLQTDPNEIKNLADSPEHLEVLKQMRAELDAWLKNTADQGQHPESPAALKALKKRWKERCVNPEFQGL